MERNFRGDHKRQVDRVSAGFAAAQNDVQHMFRDLKNARTFTSARGFRNTLFEYPLN